MTSPDIIYRCRGCGHTYVESSPHDAPFLTHRHVYHDEVVALVLAGWTIKEVWCLECATRGGTPRGNPPNLPELQDWEYLLAWQGHPFDWPKWTWEVGVINRPEVLLLTF